VRPARFKRTGPWPQRSDIFVTAGLNRLLENPSHCHPEEAKPAKDLCLCLKIQIPGFFAALKMTALKRFSATCLAPPFQICDEKSGSKIMR
jgi:hypothetical protein